MRISSVLFVVLFLTLASVCFGLSTSCKAGAPVSDGSGGFFVTGSCDFYREAAAYPFDLTPFLSSAGPFNLAENYQVAAYIVVTTDPTEVANQVGTNPANWKDVLFFRNNVGVPAEASTEADLLWDGTLPTASTVNNFLGGGFAVFIQWDPSGTTLWIPNDRLIFAIHDNLPVAGGGGGTAGTLDNQFQVHHYANLNLGDQFVDIVNTGANGASLTGPGVGGATGNICANVYAFDIGEELLTCCSCLITPNQVVSLRVNADILAKPNHVFSGTSLTIKLLSTLAGPLGTGGNCNLAATLAQNTGAPGSTNLIISGMAAWGVTIHNRNLIGPPPTSNPVFAETQFLTSTLSNPELASLTNRCNNITGNSSGFGVCPVTSCGGGSGAIGGTKM
jgi:hypothetical protein